MVTKRVFLTVATVDGSVIGDFFSDEPHSHSSDLIEHRYNESNWCANNLLDREIEWVHVDSDRLHALRKDDGCLCDKVTISFSRVIDETPRCKLKKLDS